MTFKTQKCERMQKGELFTEIIFHPGKSYSRHFLGNR